MPQIGEPSCKIAAQTNDVLPVEKRVSIRVCLFFDGTGNNRTNVALGPDSPQASAGNLISYDGDYTNVSKLEDFWLTDEVADHSFSLYVDGRSIYIPDKKVFNNGWGEIGSTHIVGDADKPIPEELTITWFSYAEDRFYAGAFALPQAAMLARFKAGLVGPMTGGKITYDRIIVGLAPEGHVSVWLQAQGVVVEVAGYQAKPADVPWTEILDNQEVTRSEYIHMVLTETLGPSGLARLARLAGAPSPVGRWERERRRYPWKIDVVGATPLSAWVRAVNGEREYFDFFKSPPRPEQRAIPRQIKLQGLQAAGRKIAVTVDLDDQRLFAAFEQLMASGDAATRTLELRLVIGGSPPTVKAFLRRQGDDPKAMVAIEPVEFTVHAVE